jgi:ABC-type amino acid transport substrate-binding protein
MDFTHMRRFLRLAFFVSLIIVPTLSAESVPVKYEGQNNLLKTEQSKLQSQQNSPTISHIQQNGELVVAMISENRIPFAMLDDNGRLIGIDIEIAQTIAAALGVNLKLMRTPTYDAAVQLVIDNKADIAISTLSLTAERAKSVLYTKHYTAPAKVLIINRYQLQKYKINGDESIEEIVKLHHPKIGVIRGSSYETFVKQLLPGADVEPYEDSPDVAFETVRLNVLKDLMDGKYFAIMDDEFEAKRILNGIPDAPLKLLVVRIKGELDPFYAVVNWRSEHFLNFVNNMFELNNIFYTIDNIYKRYKKYLERDADEMRRKWVGAFGLAENEYDPYFWQKG